MCGFIGCISKEPISYSEYHKANEHLVCRGPDKNIFYNNENKKFNNNLNKYFHFEFNRLSILDLSKGADQPMHSEISNNLLMFNGEIYNHLDLRKDLESVGVIFKTNHSDSEVILNGISNYGLSFVEKLNGQFSIFFLDNKLNKQIWDLTYPLLADDTAYLNKEIYKKNAEFLYDNKLVDKKLPPIDTYTINPLKQ